MNKLEKTIFEDHRYVTTLSLPFLTVGDMEKGIVAFLKESDYGDDDKYVYRLVWKMKYPVAGFKTTAIGLNSGNGLTKDIKDWVLRALPKLINSGIEGATDDDIYDSDVINPVVVIYLRNFGSGPERNFYVSVNGTLYKVEMWRTQKTCLLRCVAESTNTKLRTLDTRVRRSGLNMFDYVHKHYNVNYDWRNTWDDKAINIEITGNHVGLVRKAETEDKNIIFEKPKCFNRKMMKKDATKVLLIAIDFEFGWVETDRPNVKKAEEPVIGSVYWKKPYAEEVNGHTFCVAPHSKVSVTQQVISQLKLLSSEFGELSLFCYSANGKSVEHLILNRGLLETNKGVNQYIGNIEGTKIKSFRMGNIYFIDSQLLYPDSLDNFCKAMQVSTKDPIEKIMIEKGYWKEGVPNFMGLNKWMSGPLEKDKIEKDYCKQDSICLLYALEKFNRLLIDVGLQIKTDTSNGDWLLGRPSISGLAHSMLTSWKKLYTSPKEFNDILFNAYTGGRTEIFKMGPTCSTDDMDLYSQDINSSYPAQMCKGLANEVTSFQYKPSLPLDPNKNWLAKCMVWHKPVDGVGRLAVRTDTSVIFPVGTFTTWVHNFEVDDTVTILSCEMIFYYDLVDVSQFIKLLYEKRLTAGKSSSLGKTIKILINSVYGRFAMKQLRATKCLVHDGEAFKEKFSTAINYGQTVITCDKIDSVLTDRDWFEVNVEELSSPSVNYVTASRITALARKQLCDKLVDLKSRGCTLIYSDTDSIYYLRPKSLPPPENETFLGGWDADKHNSMNVKALKVYELDGEAKYKGVRNPNGVSPIQQSEQWIRKNLELYIVDMTKTSSFEYSKGIVTSDNTVVPLILNELLEGSEDESD